MAHWLDIMELAAERSIWVLALALSIGRYIATNPRCRSMRNKNAHPPYNLSVIQRVTVDAGPTQDSVQVVLHYYIV